VVADHHERPRPVRWIDAARRVRQGDDPGTKPTEEQDGLDYEAWIVALVDVEAALQHDDRAAGQPSKQQSSDVPGRRRRWPAGQVGKGDRNRILDIVRNAAKTGSQDDPDVRDDVGSGADGGFERSESGRLLDRRYRTGGVD
jgi:hypothetical protein